MGELADKVGSVFDTLNRRITELEEALEFYARPENYRKSHGVDSIIQLDHGIRAMNTLRRGKK